MKKVIYIIALLIGATTMAQTITVNGTPMLVSDDISFPFWLESGSSIDIGENVMSISIIEFALIPNSNHYDLEFLQTKIISDQEIVPDNITWKVESILLDNSDQYNTNSHAYNSRGFMLGEGSYSPDSTVYWIIDAINLKNGTSTVQINSIFDSCISDYYGNSKCRYFNESNTYQIFKLDDFSFNVELDNSIFQQDVSSCEDPCGLLQITRSFNLLDIDNINFPIYVESSNSLQIMSPDILLSIKEMKK